MGYFILAIFVIVVVVGAVNKAKAENHGRANPSATGTPEQRRAFQQLQIVCPHCQTKGGVRSYLVKRKKGISGAKATGAVLTGGLSVAATGLSRKEGAQEMSCSNCGMKWAVGA